MADPKYAKLPGIATDQPDVYETGDLPEADQNTVYQYEDNSEGIERLHISAADAFNKFKGKQLDSSRADFSDKIARSKQRGYGASSGDWELSGDGEKETPTQKYQRLRCETQELLDEISQLQGKSGKESTSSVVNITSEVEALKQQLERLKLEEILGSDVLANLTDPQKAVQQKLISLIEKSKTVDKSGKKADGTDLIYELYSQPNTEKLRDSAVLVELDKRLQRLESVLGADSEKLVRLSAETGQKSITGAISTLTSKLSLFDPANVDQIDGRLASLNMRLQQINEQKKQVESADKMNKVTELYELVHKSSSMFAALPDVVDRLVALQSLHEQAMEFSKTLAQLDVTQQQVNNSIGNNSKLLSDMDQSFTNNLSKIKENMDALGKRVADLKL